MSQWLKIDLCLHSIVSQLHLQSHGFLATAKLFVYLVIVKAGDKLVDYFQQNTLSAER